MTPEQIEKAIELAQRAYIAEPMEADDRTKPKCLWFTKGYLAAREHCAAEIEQRDQRIAELERQLEREESDSLQTIKDRDRTEKYIDKILDEVIGVAPDYREEWSSGHDFPDALVEVEEHMWALKQTSDAKDARITELEAQLEVVRSGEAVAWTLEHVDGTMIGATTLRWDVAPSNVVQRPLYLAPPPAAQVPDVAEMVNRFLGWKLPQDFYPDAGIAFDANLHDRWGGYPKSWPVGTNLLNANQAKAMIEYLLAAAPTHEAKLPEVRG